MVFLSIKCNNSDKSALQLEKVTEVVKSPAELVQAAIQLRSHHQPKRAGDRICSILLKKKKTFQRTTWDLRFCTAKTSQDICTALPQLNTMSTGQQGQDMAKKPEVCKWRERHLLEDNLSLS